MIHIENLTFNIQQYAKDADEILKSDNPMMVKDELVSMLRIISEDPRLLDQRVVIPDGCEQYGFVKGDFELPTLLYFLADMLE